jgi:hypothetical protein
MKTIREQIIERIIAELERITPTNGYHNNIGIGHVYRQESVIEKNSIPAVSVWEMSESRERNKYGGTVRVLIIKVEAIVQVNSNKQPATVSNELLADIETALIIGGEGSNLDELIDDIQDIAAEIALMPAEDNELYPELSNSTPDIVPLPIERKLAGASIDFEISYTTAWGDPYTISQ